MLSRKYTGIIIAIMIIAVAVISGCIGQTETPANNTGYVNDRGEEVPGDYIVFITASGFEPIVLTVPKDSTVIWKNLDAKGQTVFFNTTRKGSPSINPGRSWSFTFNESGKYPYYSSFYISLKGTIIVE
ncbi:MAG: cupredoxin domain-containing protein [Candidatus Aenigmarchaeota archaeon]|nr:cupredoxin domain-containing protein [Candidatus Aenigmarchaeota archaeon]